ncbi:hypothetical protein TNCV_5022571 [Trichonephila clavipes]|nr:hypothetical protein TNCV_5022571 [Trichonephila clavipes]
MPKYCKRNGSKTVLRMSLTYPCGVSVPLMKTKGVWLSKELAPDHNSWLRACVEYNSESRIGTLPWVSSDVLSIIVRTPLEARFVAEHYKSPVSLISTYSSHAPT